MIEYRSQHRCRLCSEVFESGCATGSAEMAWSAVIRLGGIKVPPDPGPQAPDLYESHHCKDGGIGLADFLGFKAVTE